MINRYVISFEWYRGERNTFRELYMCGRKVKGFSAMQQISYCNNNRHLCLYRSHIEHYQFLSLEKIISCSTATSLTRHAFEVMKRINKRHTYFLYEKDTGTEIAIKRWPSVKIKAIRNRFCFLVSVNTSRFYHDKIFSPLPLFCFFESLPFFNVFIKISKAYSSFMEKYY